MSFSHSTPGPSTIDWEQVQVSLRRRLAGRLDPSEHTELDDLVQESCIRLLRVSRRERIEDIEALVSVVARRTFRDFLRRRYRHERLWSVLDEEHGDVADPGEVVDSSFGDLIDRIEFVVLEIFASDDRQECRDLARAWFVRKNWKALAEELGLSHASVRKRWSRCLELPRKIFRGDPDLRHLFREG